MPVESSRAVFANYLQSRVAPRTRRAGAAPTATRRGSHGSMLRALWQLFRGSRLGIGVALSVLSVASCLAVAPAALTKLIIDYLLCDRPLPFLQSWLPAGKIPQLYVVGAVVAAAAVLEIVLRLACRWYIVRAALRAQMRMRRQLFQHAIRLPLHTAQQLKSGGAASILRDDVLNLPELATEVLYESWRSALRVGGSLVILLLVDWRLLLGMLCLSPLVYFNHRSWTRRIRPLHRELAERRQQIDARVTEVFGGLRVVHAFGWVRTAERQFVGRHHLLARMLMHLAKARNLESVWEGVAVVASIGALVYGGSRVIQGELSLGDLVMFLSYLAILLGPLEQLASSANILQKGLAGLERTLELLAQPSHPPVALPVVRVDRASARGQVSLTNVSFAYPEAHDLALRNVSLSIAAGEVVALVGYSGAGKTTLANLVARYYDPTAGTIALDGHDVRHIDRDNYRSLFGIVEQDVFLFDGSIAENIGFGRSDATREEIIAAAQAAHLHEFIEQTEHGYDTPVGERGLWLSGGQRQRLAIARALLVRPRILILDEATSSLDGTHEQLVQRSLEHLLAGRTCVVIAHRLSTVMRADRIIVLDRGEIVETGSHSELVTRRGHYYKLFRNQLDSAVVAPARAA